MPASRATSAAASSEAWGVATMTTSEVASLGSPGLTLSQASESRWARTWGGRSMPYLAIRASASWRVVGSPTVGPEAMTAGSSPGTSEIISATRRAGCAAAASLPPLIAERCFLTQFISSIEAPERSSALETACLSSRVSPGAGRASSDEPPPETSASTRSSGPRPWTRSRMRRAAASPAASGTGCAASTISIRRQGTAWP